MRKEHRNNEINVIVIQAISIDQLVIIQQRSITFIINISSPQKMLRSQEKEYIVEIK